MVAAKKIQERTGCRWLIFGGKNDIELARGIAARIQQPGEGEKKESCSVINLAGKTSLRALCAGLRACEVLLTNDTGPMHVAAAVGTPVVVPFGSTSSELTGPGLPKNSDHTILRSTAPCSPCFLRECPIDLRCMKQIEPEDVIAAVLAVVER